MKSIRSVRGLWAFSLLLVACPALATPPVWETDFGTALTFGGDPTCDDCQEDVTLSFSFPFQGEGSFTTVWVGTNGGIQLGSQGLDNDIDYDHWQYMEEFISDAAPSIEINSDWDLTSAGSVHFKDFGDRAVFTWNEVGTHEQETHLSSFQIQLVDNGTIVLSFNGILDGAGEDLVTSQSEGFVVGITAGDITLGQDFPLSDLNGAPFSGSNTIFQRWCYDVANSCGYDGDDLGWPGLANSAFDLDQQSVFFIPNIEDGYDVSPTGQPPQPPPSGPSVPVPATSLWSLLLLVLGVAGAGWYFTRP